LCAVCNFTSQETESSSGSDSNNSDSDNSDSDSIGRVDSGAGDDGLPRLVLRGLCAANDGGGGGFGDLDHLGGGGASTFDSRFVLDVNGFVSGRRAFAGHYGSRIYWDGRRCVNKRESR